MLRFNPKSKSESPTVEERIEMGDSLLQERRLLEALQEFETVLEKAPEFNFIHMKVGYIHFQRRNYHLALDSFHTAMELDSLSPEAPLSAGWVYLKLGDLEQSERYFHISLSINPKFDSAFIGLGQIAMQQKHYAEAVQQFRQAVELNPSLMSGQMALVEAYRCQGQIDEAIAVLEALPQGEPSFALARIQLGRLYREKRDYAAARVTFQRARDTNPLLLSLNADAQLDLAESLLTDHCLESATDTLKETPNFLKLACRKYLLQGNIYLHQGESKQALEQYLMAWKLHPFVFEHRVGKEADVTALQAELELQMALQHEQLNVDYQVIVSLDNHQHIVGIESRLQWQHPKRGLLIAEQFLPTAKKTGLVLPMGWWEIYRACWQLAQMQPHSPLLRWTGVNMNALQLQDSDLETQILFAINAVNIDPQSLLLEVDSEWLVEALSTSSPVLKKLQQLHVQLAVVVDNTDSSLFDLLYRYPISTIKIKPNVTQHLSIRENCVTVEAIAALSVNLGIETIAVGIETLEQAEQIRTLGCKYAQGSLFG